jgi:hypothetical protein
MHGQSVSQNLDVAVIAGAGTKPVITSAMAASGSINGPFSYQIQASGTPTLFHASGLPAPLRLSPANGTISGQPQLEGIFAIKLYAFNDAGSDSKTLTLSIGNGTSDSAPPVVNFKRYRLSGRVELDQGATLQSVTLNGVAANLNDIHWEITLDLPIQAQKVNLRCLDNRGWSQESKLQLQP